MKLAYAEYQSSFDEYSLIEPSERISNIDIDDLDPSDLMDMIEQECETQYSEVKYETKAGQYICRFAKKNYLHLWFDGVDWKPISRDIAIAGLD